MGKQNTQIKEIIKACISLQRKHEKQIEDRATQEHANLTPIQI